VRNLNRPADCQKIFPVLIVHIGKGSVNGYPVHFIDSGSSHRYPQMLKYGSAHELSGWKNRVFWLPESGYDLFILWWEMRPGVSPRAGVSVVRITPPEGLWLDGAAFRLQKMVNSVTPIWGVAILG